MTKKYLFSFMLVFLLMVQTAFAQKYDFKDSSFNFKGINTLVLYDLDTTLASIENDVLEKSLNETYRTTASKNKFQTITEEALNRKISIQQGVDLDSLVQEDYAAYENMIAEHRKDFAQLYIEATLKSYQTKSTYIPEWTTWETKKEETKFTDNNGYTSTQVNYITVPVHHPGYYETNTYITLEYKAFDAKTGKEVFSRVENRAREGNDGRGMFQRITNEFFRDLKKLT